MSSPFPDKDIMCHHTGFKRSCFDIVSKCKCRKWVSVKGRHPQTGDMIDNWNCADNWGPQLMVENSAKQRDTAAEMNALRNETAKQNSETRIMISQCLKFQGETQNQVRQALEVFHEGLADTHQRLADASSPIALEDHNGSGKDSKRQT